MLPRVVSNAFGRAGPKLSRHLTSSSHALSASRNSNAALFMAATTFTLCQPIAIAHMMSTCASRPPATADLCDDHEHRLQVADGNAFHSFGQHSSFCGEIVTIKCFENNPLVRATLSEPGEGRVLVVDGGGSLRRALFGDNIAALAVKNGWAGVVIYGAIRDSAVINTMPLGVKALGTNPVKSAKQHPGDRNVVVTFAGVTFKPGHYVYSDSDGIIVSETPLHQT
ncbi:regulator of ribonuclease activity a [Nannochloropsis gaditana]|uniref:4-hydroxy-4-methyl-2-oxoglutarate aldolase n=4 Tax=Nannochloropsis gaditana TaxID=72520 RepID=W7U9K1_9STRA|nr:regulator of ribonuclease activity a [Nannochloropsis gaditana]